MILCIVVAAPVVVVIAAVWLVVGRRKDEAWSQLAGEAERVRSMLELFKMTLL
jgi:hypothetical protein